MSKKPRTLGLVLIMGTLMLSLASCKSARKNDSSTENPGDSNSSDTSSAPLNTGDDNTLGDSDSGKAMGLQTIHFAYDSSAIVGEGAQAFKTDLEILKTHPTLKIQIEGHCDQRGGIQYNIALGERRANSVRNAFKKEGITEDRLSTISYGKERPLDNGTSEAAYTKNRRANFAITSK